MHAGTVAFRRGDWNEAEKQYQAALEAAESEKDREAAVIGLLETYVRSVRTREALKFIEQASVEDGKYHLLVGKAYLQAEEYPAAEKAFSLAQSLPSSEQEVLGEATYLLGKTRDVMYAKNPTVENRLLALRVWENFLRNHCRGDNPPSKCLRARERVGRLTES